MTPARSIALRPPHAEDVPTFFAHQCEPAACAMAIWEPRDWPACSAHWQRILSDPTTLTRTVLVDGAVAGYVASFERENRREVCYWIGSEFWGRGIASDALASLLTLESARPLLARVAESNRASIRILEKCCFQAQGRHVGDDGVAEVWLVLERAS